MLFAKLERQQPSGTDTLPVLPAHSIRLRLRNAIFHLILLSCSSLLSAQTPQYVLTEWMAVEGADYYDGIIVEEGRSTRFRTKGHWFLHRQDQELAISPIRAGRALPIAPKMTRTALGEEDPLIPDPQSLSESVEAPDTSEVLSAEDNTEPAVIEPLIWNKQNVFTLGLGMGQEAIEASAGISEFSGTTSTGGTALMLSSLDEASGVVFSAELEAHNFATQPDFGTNELILKKKYLQIRTLQQFLVRVLPGPTSLYSGLYLGGGFSYKSLALLDMAYAETGAAHLRSENILSLFGSGQYYWRLYDRGLLLAGAQATPFSLSGKHRELSLSGKLAWHHLLSPMWLTYFGLHYFSEEFVKDLDCPEVTNCQEKSENSVRFFELKTGISLAL
jgi:hypothetical protein